MLLKNYMEDVVLSIMDEVIGNMEICKCEKCKMDIAAIALNNLPPKYVVTDKGELYSKVNFLKGQFNADVILEITKAAMIVKRLAHH